MIHLNASHERGIDIVRNDIYKFVNNKNFFNDKMKFVVLDEVDSMTKQAQISLDYIIQRSSNVFFCLICNYLNKIIDPLKNKLIVVNFYNTSNGSGELIDSLLQNEKKDVPKEVIEDLKFIYNHDLQVS